MAANERETTILKVSPEGAISGASRPLTYRDGFAQLLDLDVRPPVNRSLAAEDVTRIGFERVGSALWRALAQARERFGE